MGLFAKVAGAAKVAEPKRVSKGTAWKVTDPAQVAQVDDAINGFVALDREIKAIGGRQKPLKTFLASFCEDLFIRDFARLSILPETPMNLFSSKGEKLTYVVQDRSSASKVGDDQIDAIKNEFGEEVLAKLVGEVTTFGFNQVLMQDERVSSVVEKHLMAAIEELTSPSGKGKSAEPAVLTADQAEQLIEADKKVTFFPGSVARLPSIVGSNVASLKAALEIMGGACVRYPKS